MSDEMNDVKYHLKAKLNIYFALRSVRTPHPNLVCLTPSPTKGNSFRRSVQCYLRPKIFFFVMLLLKEIDDDSHELHALRLFSS